MVTVQPTANSSTRAVLDEAKQRLEALYKGAEITEDYEEDGEIVLNVWTREESKLAFPKLVGDFFSWWLPAKRKHKLYDVRVDLRPIC